MGRFKKKLLRNLILINIPVLICISAVILICSMMSRLPENRIYGFKDGSSLKVFYDGNLRNVETDIRGAKYTGFDLEEDGNVIGRYYYKVSGNSAVYYVLDVNTADSFDRSEDEAFPVRAEIIKDRALSDYITYSLLKDSGISEKSAESYGREYIFSEVDFPYVRIAGIRIVSRTAVIMLLIILIYIIAAAAFPPLNFASWGLRSLGSVRDMIDDIDKEMTREVLYEWGRICITDNYLIRSGISLIEVIRLDDIEYISKHEEYVRKGLGRSKMVYRMTCSNVRKLYFEHDEEMESVLDGMISAIRGEQ